MKESGLSAARMKVILAAHLLAEHFGAVADTGRILAVIAAAVPNRPEIVAAQARNLMLAAQYAEARELLQRTEAQHPANAAIKAMLALCLFAQTDPLWEAYAEEALALPRDVIAHSIIETLATRSGKSMPGLQAEAEPSSPSPMAYVGLHC